MTTRILHLLTTLTLGKNLATALLLLRLIADAVENRKVENIARFVFGKLPQNWRSPKGPATESEFVDMIEAGQLFLGKVKAVLQA